MRIEILGIPIAKARHRTFVRGGRTMQYDPQNIDKERVRSLFSQWVLLAFNHKNNGKFQKPSNFDQEDTFFVNLCFHLPFSRSLNVGQKNRILWGFKEPDDKPDIDNLIKFYLDCANGILFPDDRMVTVIHAEKVYSTTPKTVIEIMPRKKLNLQSDAESILEVISPTELCDLIDRFDELLTFCSMFQNSVTQTLKTTDPEAYQEKLTAIASLLSYLADNYSPLLSKIHRKWPKFHEKK